MANSQPHDRLIKETLSHLEEAIRFFKKFLPAHLSNRLDFNSLRLENATFLNEEGKEIYSDLVFSCHWQDTGKPVLLYLLLELKSVPEQRPHLQIGSYLNEGYLLQAKQLREEKKKDKLIQILPILLYHGEESWEIPDFSDYFHLADPSLGRYLPAFEVIMINLAAFSDEEIIELGACLLVSTLLAFKHKHDKEYVLRNADKVFIFVNAKGQTQEELARFFRVFLRYLFQAFRFEKPERNIITIQIPKVMEPVFESTYDMLVREGEIIGLEKGKSIGLKEGKSIGLEEGKSIGLEEGERKRSLEVGLGIVMTLPTLTDSEVAHLSKLPEAFVVALRECLTTNNLRKAQQIAAGLFADLPGFSNEDVKKVKKLVKDAWKRQAGA